MTANRAPLCVRPSFTLFANRELATKIRAKCLKATQNQLHETQPLYYPPYEFLKKRLLVACFIKVDKGYTYGNYTLWCCSSSAEILRTLPNQAGQLIRWYDEKNDSLSLSKQNQFKLQCLIKDCKYNTVKLATCFANAYVENQCDSVMQTLDRKIEKILTQIDHIKEIIGFGFTDIGDLANSPPLHEYTLHTISSMLLPDHMMIGINDQSKTFEFIPYVKAFFFTAQYRFDDDGNAERVGLARNSMKTLFNEWDIIDDKIEQEAAKRPDEDSDEEQEDRDYRNMERHAIRSRVKAERATQRKYEKYLRVRERLERLIQSHLDKHGNVRSSDNDNDA